MGPVVHRPGCRFSTVVRCDRFRHSAECDQPVQLLRNLLPLPKRGPISPSEECRADLSATCVFLGLSALLNFAKVVAQPIENVAALPIGNLPFDFVQRKVVDVVVVYLLIRQTIAQFEPHLV